MHECACGPLEQRVTRERVNSGRESLTLLGNASNPMNSMHSLFPRNLNFHGVRYDGAKHEIRDEICGPIASMLVCKKGDTTELMGVDQVFGMHRTKVASTKATTGHLMAGAGAVELVLTMIGLQQKLAPCTVSMVNPLDADVELSANKSSLDSEFGISLSHALNGHSTAVLVRNSCAV